MMKRLAWVLLLLLPAIPRPSSIMARDEGLTYDQAADKLFSQGFPQKLETYFCSLGTNPDLGFRWAGTTAERAVGDRVAAEMRAMGLSNVRLEPVPVDAKMSSWWFCPPAVEAAHRKAAGVICTYISDDRKYYSVNDRALGSFDGQYDLSAPPWVYISRRDGDWLKSELRTGPVTATMILPLRKGQGVERRFQSFSKSAS
jgi:hypothetical protein